MTGIVCTHDLGSQLRWGDWQSVRFACKMTCLQYVLDPRRILQVWIHFLKGRNGVIGSEARAHLREDYTRRRNEFL